MPQYDLRGIYAAQYNFENDTVSYTNRQRIGDAMSVILELRFAEGRLYAESTLSEYKRKVVGGTISIGVKYIFANAQKLMLGSRENTRNVSYTPSSGGETATSAVSGLVTGGKTQSKYVGVAFYAPDTVDGKDCFTCIFVKRTLFGSPGMSLQTAGENIVFNTPTISGEFMADGTANRDLLEVAVCDDENAAIAWVQEVLT